MQWISVILLRISETTSTGKHICSDCLFIVFYEIMYSFYGTCVSSLCMILTINLNFFSCIFPDQINKLYHFNSSIYCKCYLVHRYDQLIEETIFPYCLLKIFYKTICIRCYVLSASIIYPHSSLYLVFEMLFFLYILLKYYLKWLIFVRRGTSNKHWIHH